MSTPSSSRAEHGQPVRFVCLRCGNCCKGDGVVRLEQEEIPRIAGLLGLEVDEFLARFTQEEAWDGPWLIDKFEGEERWCVFLERDGDGPHRCRIQEAKPEQCKTFPYKWRFPRAHEVCAGLRGESS